MLSQKNLEEKPTSWRDIPKQWEEVSANDQAIFATIVLKIGEWVIREDESNELQETSRNPVSSLWIIPRVCLITSFTR